MKWFSSDWHLGHNGIFKLANRDSVFENIDTMNKEIIYNTLSPLREGDDFYFLGDLSWNKEDKV